MISESDSLLFWLIVIFLISICVVFIVSWTNALKHLYLNDALQPTAYEARLIYSDKCFAYKDETGRVHTGTIDLSKVTKERFYDCVPLSTADDHALQIVLTTEKGSIVTMESSNWKINTQQIIQHSYVVDVYGEGQGMLTFGHKTGK
jgi:hypothetical protein